MEAELRLEGSFEILYCRLHLCEETSSKKKKKLNVSIHQFMLLSVLTHRGALA